MPQEYTAYAESKEIRPEEILYVAKYDRERDGGFAEGVLVLTKTTLFLWKQEPEQGAGNFKRKIKKKHIPEKICRKFREIFKVQEKKTETKKKEIRISEEEFDLCEVEKLFLVQEVGGGSLVLRKKQEEPDDMSEDERVERLGSDLKKNCGEKEQVTETKSAESGPEYRIALFSNACTSGIRLLVKRFDLLKKGEEPDEGSFKLEKSRERCPKCGTIYPDQERKICPKCMDRKSVFLRILAYFKPYIPQIAIMFLCYIGVALLNMAWPYLNGTVLYDKVLAKNDDFLAIFGFSGGKYMAALGLLIVIMFLTRLTTQLLGIIQGVFTAKIVPEVVEAIKGRVFEAMGKLSIRFFNSRQTGSLMTRVLDDAGNVTGFFIDGLPYFFINILTIILTCVVMFRMNWKLALITLAFFPVMFFISAYMMPRLWTFYGRRHRANRSLNAQINDNIRGARVVKAFGQEAEEMKRFGGYNSRVKSTELNLVKYNTQVNALYSVVQNLISLVIISLGGLLVLRGEEGMELGVLISFIGYAGQLNGPLDFSRVCHL